MTKTAHIMVGLPGSGKSTFITKLVEDTGITKILSTDAIIDRHAASLGRTYDDVFDNMIGIATGQFNNELTIAINEGESVIIDQTNVGKKKREALARRFAAAGYKVYVNIVECSDKEEWKRRLASRPGKTIPEYVLNSMQKSYSDPYHDDFKYECITRIIT